MQIIALCAGLMNATRAAQPDSDGVLFIEAKIRPVLVEHCYKCHSSESKKNKGDLLLKLIQSQTFRTR